MTNGSGLNRPRTSSGGDASPRSPISRRGRGAPIRQRVVVPRSQMVLRSQARRLRGNVFPAPGFGRGRGLRSAVHRGSRAGLRRRIVANENNLIQVLNGSMARGVSRRGRPRGTFAERVRARIARRHSRRRYRRAGAGRGYRDSVANRNDHQNLPPVNESNGGGVESANQRDHSRAARPSAGQQNSIETGNDLRSSVGRATQENTPAKPKATSSNQTKNGASESSGKPDMSTVVDDGELPSTSNGRATSNRDSSLAELVRGQIDVLPPYPPPNVPMELMDSYSLPAGTLPLVMAGVRHFRISRLMREERQHLRLRMQSRGTTTTPKDVIATGDGNHNDPMVTITVVPCTTLQQQYDEQNEAAAEGADGAEDDGHDADANDANDGDGSSSDAVSHVSDDTIFVLNNRNEDGLSEYTIHSTDYWPIFDVQPIYDEANGPEPNNDEDNDEDDA